MFGGSLPTSCTSSFSVLSLKSTDEKAKEYQQKLQLIGAYEQYCIGFTYTQYQSWFNDDIETIRKYFKASPEESKPKSKKRKGNREYSKRMNSDDEADELDTDSGEEEFAKKNDDDSDSVSSVEPTSLGLTKVIEMGGDYKSRNPDWHTKTRKDFKNAIEWATFCSLIGEDPRFYKDDEMEL
jgi:hypothetical protein